MLIFIQDLIFKIINFRKVNIFATIIGSKKIFLKKNVVIYKGGVLKTFKQNNKPEKHIFIDRDSEIRNNCFIFSGAGNINIGKRVSINVNSVILGGGNVEIQDNVIISPNVTISSSGHEFSDLEKPINQQNDTFGKIKIEKNVWIGSNSVIIQGVTIGEGSVIGSNSTVTKNIPAFSVAVGSPAKVIKKRISKLRELENLILEFFQEVPFHNLFMMYDISKFASHLGGTCSDRVVYFKNILEKNNFNVKLHSSFINGKEIHRLLKVTINSKIYFVDIGSGWPSIKPFPIDKEINYNCCGIEFFSEIDNFKQKLSIKMKRKSIDKIDLICEIPFVTKSEKEILEDIKNRFNTKSNYPFKDKLRYSFMLNKTFYFIRGDEVFTYFL